MTGIVSAGAGVGTNALFSDTETVEDNRIAGGELDLKVAWHKVVESATTQVATSKGWPTPRTDPRAPVCDLTDVSPGDRGRLTLSFRIDDIAGHLFLLGTERTDAERSVTEPEADALRESVPPDREGELDELTTMTLSYLVPDDPAVPEAGGTTTHAHTTSLSSFVAFSGLAEGVPLDGDLSATVSALVAGDASLDAYPGTTTHYLCIEWTVPDWAGSGVASDAFAFDVHLLAHQQPDT